MTSCYLSAYIPAPHLAFWSGRPYFQSRYQAVRDERLNAAMARRRRERQAARQERWARLGRVALYTAYALCAIPVVLVLVALFAQLLGI